MVPEVKLNLKAAAELQLNAEQMILLSTLLDKTRLKFYQAQAIKDENSNIFYLFSPASIVIDTPILTIDCKGDNRAKTVKIQRMLAQLTKKNLIVPHIKNQILAKTYYTFSIKSMRLFCDSNDYLTQSCVRLDQNHTQNCVRSEDDHTQNCVRSEDDHTQNCVRSEDDHTQNCVRYDQNHTQICVTIEDRYSLEDSIFLERGLKGENKNGEETKNLHGEQKKDFEKIPHSAPPLLSENEYYDKLVTWAKDNFEAYKEMKKLAGFNYTKSENKAALKASIGFWLDSKFAAKFRAAPEKFFSENYVKHLKKCDVEKLKVERTEKEVTKILQDRFPAAAPKFTAWHLDELQKPMTHEKFDDRMTHLLKSIENPKRNTSKK